MLSALRIGRLPAVFLSPPPPPPTLSSISTSFSSAVRGRRAAAASFCAAAEPQEAMDSKNTKQQELSTDPLAESFGTAYATRCEEEGFGGIYATLPKEGDNVAVGEVRPGCDRSQGRQVKGKEKGRNEREATSTT